MNILVRNLPRGLTGEDLLQLFQPFGEIKSYTVVTDEGSGSSKGFGFVDMPDNSEAVSAIKALNGKVINSLKIRVKAGHPPRKTFSSKPAGPKPERVEMRGKRTPLGAKPGRTETRGKRTPLGAKPERTESRGNRRPVGPKPERPETRGKRRPAGASPERPETRGKRPVGPKPERSENRGKRKPVGPKPERAGSWGKRKSVSGKPGGASSLKARRPKREGRR